MVVIGTNAPMAIFNKIALLGRLHERGIQRRVLHITAAIELSRCGRLNVVR